MQRISKLKLKNFKFFFGDVELDFDRQNILIYGENGSGKSSIYWALYTLLECANKEDDAGISKYFTAGNDACLTNIFLPNGAPDYVESEIKIDLNDGSSFRLSPADLIVRTEADAQASNYASEFLNYKMLFRIHCFYSWYS